MDYAPLARIALRILSWTAVGWGLASEAEAESIFMNPDVVMVAGFVVAGLVESWYALAKRKGWAT